MVRKQSESHLDRGAAAVEMALVLPLLILFTFGIIDFSRVFNAEIQISQAAREGARMAALAGSVTGFDKPAVKARVALAAPNPGFGPTPAGVLDSDIVMCPNSASLAKVTVTYDYQGILFSFQGAKKLTQTAVMICGG